MGSTVATVSCLLEKVTVRGPSITPAERSTPAPRPNAAVTACTRTTPKAAPPSNSSALGVALNANSMSCTGARTSAQLPVTKSNRDRVLPSLRRRQSLQPFDFRSHVPQARVSLVPGEWVDSLRHSGKAYLPALCDWSKGNKCLANSERLAPRAVVGDLTGEALAIGAFDRGFGEAHAKRSLTHGGGWFDPGRPQKRVRVNSSRVQRHRSAVRCHGCSGG